MNIRVNGEPLALAGEMNLRDLLSLLEVPQVGVAVAKNDRVVPFSQIDTHVVVDGDRIEIIKAAAGG